MVLWSLNHRHIPWTSASDFMRVKRQTLK
jgi:hypothetical protein